MLNMKKSDFVHIFSVRSRLRAHINVLATLVVALQGSAQCSYRDTGGFSSLARSSCKGTLLDATQQAA